MRKCYAHEECEYNAQPEFALPDGAKCPHGVPMTNVDGTIFAKMAQASLDDAMEMVDNHMEATNSWIPFYVGKAWAYLELLRKVEEETP